FSITQTQKSRSAPRGAWVRAGGTAAAARSLIRVSATIVAAVDDSPASLQAARLLAGYRGDARQLGIVALNVQTRPLALWPRPGVDPARIESALLAQGARHLEPACKLLAAA